MAYDPAFSTNPVVGALESHRGFVERTRENSARYAMAYQSFSSVGTGEFNVGNPILFGCRFQDQPIVAYGHSLDGLQLVLGAFPRCFGGVRAWIMDDREMYIGAYCYFIVDIGGPPATTGTPPPPPTTEEQALIDTMVITHDFTFTSIALKTLPEELLQRA